MLLLDANKSSLTVETFKLIQRISKEIGTSEVWIDENMELE